MPCGGQRACIGLIVAKHAGDDQAGVVEDSAESVAKRLAQLAAFVDRPRCRRRHMAGNATRERNCLKSFFMPARSCVRLTQQRVVVEVPLPHRQVVRGTLVSVHLLKHFGCQRVTRHRSSDPQSITSRVRRPILNRDPFSENYLLGCRRSVRGMTWFNARRGPVLFTTGRTTKSRLAGFATTR